MATKKSKPTTKKVLPQDEGINKLIKEGNPIPVNSPAKDYNDNYIEKLNGEIKVYKDKVDRQVERLNARGGYCQVNQTDIQILYNLYTMFDTYIDEGIKTPIEEMYIYTSNYKPPVPEVSKCNTATNTTSKVTTGIIDRFSEGTSEMNTLINDISNLLVSLIGPFQEEVVDGPDLYAKDFITAIYKQLNGQRIFNIKLNQILSGLNRVV